MPFPEAVEQIFAQGSRLKQLSRPNFQQFQLTSRPHFKEHLDGATLETKLATRSLSPFLATKIPKRMVKKLPNVSSIISLNTSHNIPDHKKEKGQILQEKNYAQDKALKSSIR